MTLNIELKPDEEQVLLERARLSGRDPVQYVEKLIRDHILAAPQMSARDAASPKGTGTIDDLTDYEAIESCAREIEGKTIPSIEEVRAALSKIPGSMAQVVIEEREDRF